MATVYTYQDFQSIKNSGINYQLPENIVSIIQILEGQIQQIIQNSATEQSERPVRKHFEKTVHSSSHSSYNSANQSDRRRPNSNSGAGSGYKKSFAVSSSDENWNSGKSIKMTPKLVNENSDKTITEIRSSLNKLSPKNIDTQQTIIIENIQQILDDPENVTKIAQMIFDIASSNKFMSEIYAQLYRILVDNFSIFKSQLNNLFENYKTSLNEIFYVNPDIDYDGYCKYTKINDGRKALTTFFVNLMKNEVLEKDLVLEMILYIIIIIYKYAEEPNKTAEIEEIVENLYILITQSDSILNTTEIWTEEIVPKIHDLSKLRKTNGMKYPSMTNRSTFKLMDVLDSLN